MPFTMVKFLIEKPKTGAVVYFTKNNKILVDDVAVQKDSLENYLDKLPLAKYHDINFCFDKNSTFDSYIKNQMIIRSMEIEFAKPENFIF